MQSSTRSTVELHRKVAVGVGGGGHSSTPLKLIIDYTEKLLSSAKSSSSIAFCITCSGNSLVKTIIIAPNIIVKQESSVQMYVLFSEAPLYTMLWYAFTESAVTIPRLNVIKWKDASGVDHELKLLEEMSIKWKEWGETVSISKTKLNEYEHNIDFNNKACMGATVRAWLQMDSEEVCYQ